MSISYIGASGGSILHRTRPSNSSSGSAVAAWSRPNRYSTAG